MVVAAEVFLVVVLFLVVLVVVTVLMVAVVMALKNIFILHYKQPTDQAI